MILDPAQLVADIAARIAAADKESHDAAAAFAAGKHQEYWDQISSQVLKRIADAGNEFAKSAGGDSGASQ